MKHTRFKNSKLLKIKNIKFIKNSQKSLIQNLILIEIDSETSKIYLEAKKCQIKK